MWSSDTLAGTWEDTTPGRPCLSSQQPNLTLMNLLMSTSSSSSLSTTSLKEKNTTEGGKEKKTGHTAQNEHELPIVTSSSSSSSSFRSPIMSVCDDNMREEIFSLLPPAAVACAMQTTKTWTNPAIERLYRTEIHVPSDISTLNSALDEVQELLRMGAPFTPPTIIVGPGKHMLRGGLLLINQSGVNIVGTVQKDLKTGVVIKMLTQLVGRVRVECGADNVTVADMKICNPHGAGVYCTGKGTTMLLKHCKISGCRGNGIFARQGALCEMIDCNISNNDSTGIAAWDEKTQLNISDTYIHTNQGDGANASTGAALAVTGATRIRSNSGDGLRTLDDDARIIVASSISCEQQQTGNVVAEVVVVAGGGG